jgi:hypothetical protein
MGNDDGKLIRALNPGKDIMYNGINGVVRGFPTVVFFSSDGRSQEFKGPRTVEALHEAALSFF